MEDRTFGKCIAQSEPFGTFRNFASLKALVISEPILWREDEGTVKDVDLAAFLPSSSESLTIDVYWSDSLIQVFETLAAKVQTELPLLSRIECTFHPVPLRRASVLKNLFQGKGVDLVMINKEEYDKCERKRLALVLEAHRNRSPALWAEIGWTPDQEMLELHE